MKQETTFIEIEVRDYECDMGGIVNNAIYFNYLEHGRHKHIKLLGIDFATYAQQGINFVVIRSEADYKASLVSGDLCAVHTSMTRISRGRFQFCQQIIRLPDNKLMLDAKVTATALNQRGRPEIPEALDKLIPFMAS